MNDEKITVRMDLEKVNEVQKLLLECLKINNIDNITTFGALSLLTISVAITGNMDKKEFLRKMFNWWDSIEEYNQEINEKGPS